MRREVVVEECGGRMIDDCGKTAMKDYGAALNAASKSASQVVSVKMRLTNSVVAVTYISSHVYRYDAQSTEV